MQLKFLKLCCNLRMSDLFRIISGSSEVDSVCGLNFVLSGFVICFGSIRDHSPGLLGPARSLTLGGPPLAALHWKQLRKQQPRCLEEHRGALPSPGLHHASERLQKAL